MFCLYGKSRGRRRGFLLLSRIRVKHDRICTFFAFKSDALCIGIAPEFSFQSLFFKAYSADAMLYHKVFVQCIDACVIGLLRRKQSAASMVV